MALSLHRFVDDFLLWWKSVDVRLQRLAVMYTDLTGSSAYCEKHGPWRLLDMVRKHNALVEECACRHGGTFLRVCGDGTQSIFDNGVQAARCAITLMRRAAAHNAADELHGSDHAIRLRVGIHPGKALVYRFRGQTELVGNAPNFGARVEAAGGKRPDEVLLSEAAAAELLEYPEEFVTVPLGSVERTGPGALRVYRLLWREEDILDRRKPDGAHPPRAEEGTCRAVSCLFTDADDGRGYVLPVRVRLHATADPRITGPTGADPVTERAAVRGNRAAFAVLRRLDFDGAQLERYKVEWSVEGSPHTRLRGPWLGLGVALATVAAFTEVQVDSRVVVTGAVVKTRVVPALDVASKWLALRTSGKCRALVLHPESAAALPPSAKTDTRLRVIEVPTVAAAVLDVLGPALGLAAGRLASLELTAADAVRAPVRICLWVGPPKTDREVANFPAEKAGKEFSACLGDAVRICACADQDCHLAVARVTATGEVSLMHFGAVAANQVVSFPPASDRTGHRLLGPPGRERVIAVASSRALRLGAEDLVPDASGEEARPLTRDVGMLARALREDLLGREEIGLYVSAREHAVENLPVRVRGTRTRGSGGGQHPPRMELTTIAVLQPEEEVFESVALD